MRPLRLLRALFAKVPAPEKRHTKRDLKRALRHYGLHDSFFTKRRTRARRRNYAEALERLTTSQQEAAVAIWGRP